MYNCINYLQAKSHLSSKRKIWVFTKAARQKFIRVTILWWPCPNLSSLIFTFLKKKFKLSTLYSTNFSLAYLIIMASNL